MYIVVDSVDEGGQQRRVPAESDGEVEWEMSETLTV